MNEKDSILLTSDETILKKHPQQLTPLAQNICGRTKTVLEGDFCIKTLRRESKKTGISLTNLIIDGFASGKLSPEKILHETYTEAEYVGIYRSLCLTPGLTPDLWKLYKKAFKELLTIKEPNPSLTSDSHYFMFLRNYLRLNCPFFREMGEELLQFMVFAVEDETSAEGTFSLGKALGGEGLTLLIDRELRENELLSSEDLKARGN